MAANNSVLVTGSAGFIGFHLSRKLSESGYNVVGFDNVNSYYDPQLKESRLKILSGLPTFTFVKGDLKDARLLQKLFTEHNFEYVINLAAQAGVRYSIENPHAYLESNLQGFLNILEVC